AEVEAVEVTRARPGPAGPRARAAADLTAGAYAWLIVSSPRALDHVDLTGLPATTGLAVVGEATARRVTRALGRRADLVGAGSSAALIDLEPLSAGPAPGATGAARRILLPGSALRGTTLIDGLTAAGWAVDEVPAYTMEPVALSDLPGGFVGRWSTGAFDAVVLTAGSSSRALAGLAGTPPSSTRVAALGRPTAAAAGEAGFVVDVVASSPTPPGVRAAVVDALSSRPRRTPFSAREDEPHE
ncbi:uroporphyrinogen-III synthase, partial [uncultured Actinomyces sp.]